MIRRFFSIVVVACFLAATPHFAGAHGGGLNSAGCHNETATGGYHCHPGGGDDKTRDTLLIVVGSVVVLGLVLFGFKKYRERQSLLVDETPDKGLHFKAGQGDQVGAFFELRW